MPKLAIDGGKPVRDTILPYGHQLIDEDDVSAVAQALRSDWLTTGPRVDEFEEAFAERVQGQHAVAVSSGTAALHAAIFAIAIGPGDEVIVPPITFAASANCVVYQGGTPVFADVEPDTLLIDLNRVQEKITPRTRAILAVDYAGQPCDYDGLATVAKDNGVALIADACHALGADYHGRAVGSLADITTFSLHAVKHITAGEGGVCSTNDERLGERMRIFRNHGIMQDFRQREALGSWFYEMTELGFNYRLTDIQSALALSQLKHLDDWIARRREIAHEYDRAFAAIAGVNPLVTQSGRGHAHHLYVIRVERDGLGVDRRRLFEALRCEGIGVNVHYIPVHLHPFYRSRQGTGPGLCPVAEAAYETILSLPMFPAMTDRDVGDVITAVAKVTSSI